MLLGNFDKELNSIIQIQTELEKDNILIGTSCAEQH